MLEADMYMRMQYETAYGIYNHFGPDDPNVPWPLMLASHKEGLMNIDPLDFRLDQYAENKVFDLFGIPFDVLIQFTRHDFLKVINSAKKHNARLLTAANGLKKLEEDLKKQQAALAHQQQQQKS